MTTNAIEPASLGELQTLCKHYSESGFFGAMTPQQALVIAMAGRDLGFSYTQALRAFHLLKGKPTLSADGMVAAVLSRGVCEYFRPVEQTDTSATWEAKRVNCEPVRYTFTLEDAQRAGLVNEMYRKHPRRMLSARAKAYLARDLFPEVLMGLVTEDEAEEIGRKAPAQPRQAQPAPTVIAEPVAEIPARRDPCAMADACTSVAELARVWRDIAHERSEMSDTEADALKAYFAARKAELGGAPSTSGGAE